MDDQNHTVAGERMQTINGSLTELRERRRDRLLSAMERANLDVLLLGRGSNVEYASGCRDLTARPHPWAPRAALLAATGRVHVMSFLDAGDEGIPPELTPNDLFRNSPNPVLALAHLQEVAHISGNPMIGVDGFSLRLFPLLRDTFPHAHFVSAESLVREARRKKFPEEVACITEAAGVASAALSAACRRLRHGISERALQAEMLTEMTRQGATLFSHMGTICSMAPGDPIRWLTSDRPIKAGSMVLAATGAFRHGYEGRLARTWQAPGGSPDPEAEQLRRRCQTVMDAMIDECRPGKTGLDLVRRYEATGERLPNVSIVRSVGIGDEGPIAAPDWSEEWVDSQHLVPNMVLSVRVLLALEGRSFIAEDMVHVSSGGPKVLTATVR